MKYVGMYLRFLVIHYLFVYYFGNNKKRKRKKRYVILNGVFLYLKKKCFFRSDSVVFISLARIRILDGFDQVNDVRFKLYISRVNSTNRITRNTSTQRKH